MLGHKPATQPPVVVDSGNYLDDQQSQLSPEIIENPSSNHSLSTSDDGAASSSVSTERSTGSQSNQTDRTETTPKTTSRKRKRSKFDVAGELMDKLIGMQEKSEKMMMDLEEKRTRLEEKQIELEATMRREERDFQFKMMSMMMRNANPVPPTAVPHYSMHSGYPYSHGFDAQGTSFDGRDHNSFDPDATQEGL